MSGPPYAVIYADPPWRFETWSDKGQDRSPERHYPTMTVAEICALPVWRLAARDCALLLWVTDPGLEAAFAVLHAWGFRYSTVGFYWVKRDARGPQNARLGKWTRANPEQCWLAKRGSPPRLATNVDRLVEAPAGRHSEKPEEVARRIERLLPGPYLELFARRTRPSWDVWGNQVRAAPGGRVAVLPGFAPACVEDPGWAAGDSKKLRGGDGRARRRHA